jgi:putative transposase
MKGASAESRKMCCMKLHEYPKNCSRCLRYEISLGAGTEVKEIFWEVAGHYGFEIEEMSVAPDHVHMFLSFPRRYSIARVVGMLKSISASEIFDKFPEVRKQLWGGEFWGDGYFARTVGDKITADLIKRYIKYHRDGVHATQLKLL